MPEARTTVAAFDVDGTLTTRDCVTAFLWRTLRLRLALVPARRPAAVLGAVVRRDRDRLKELVCAAFAGVDEDALDLEGEAFAYEVERRWLRDDTVARLRRHRELGHRVVLVSASLEQYLRPLGRRLGVDGVVCTRLEQGADGRLTGRLAGANCRGAEKVRRFDAWLAEHDLAGATVWAYGDSAGDAELLGRADRPVWVRGVHVDVELPRPSPG
jgi:phosphatidylglycerophosphatase C